MKMNYYFHELDSLFYFKNYESNIDIIVSSGRRSKVKDNWAQTIEPSELFTEENLARVKALKEETESLKSSSSEIKPKSMLQI